LWDIKGKALNVPVYQLLGGKVRDKVNTYCHLGGEAPEALLADARQKVSEGWNCLRWASGAQPDGIYDPNKAVTAGLDAIRLLRGELGPDVELCFDAHTRMSLPEAARLCRGAEEYRPMFIEDPLRIENPESYRRLRDQTSVPLAAGEQLGNKWQFRALIEEELAVHNPIGPVSTTACLHLNLATPNVLVQELPSRPGDSLADVISTSHRWSDGWLIPSDEPGLGLKVDWEAFEKYPFTHENVPTFQRQDGSFTNW
ncbi:MAG: mandelate racemase/muconate lactonizing enzyme family protein, partial [Fimbriimonadaceae bacterium]